MITEFIEKCLLLSQIPSVTMFEKPLYNTIIKQFGFNNYIKDINPNYIAFIPKRNKSEIIVSVHIDRLGLVYNGENFTYSNYYGYKHKGKRYTPTKLFGDRFVGEEVIAYNLQGDPLSEGRVIDYWIRESQELLFKIDGIKINKLPAPTPVAYKSKLVTKNGQLQGQIDNVVGVTLAYFILRSGIGCTVIFTTQEEIGESWKFIQSFLSKYQLSNTITIDTTSIEGFSDFNSTDIVFRISDDLADYNYLLVQKLLSLSREKELKYFLKTKNPKDTKIKTITEIGRLTKESSGRYSGASIQFPVIKYHTNHETMKIRNIEIIYSFIKDLCTASLIEESPPEPSRPF